MAGLCPYSIRKLVMHRKLCRMVEMMKAVIMAGGKGTRIAAVHSEVPKPMIMLSGKPILEYQIGQLKGQGIKEFILIVGHLQEKIIDYFETGDRFGVHIEYIREEEPMGTAGSLYELKSKVSDDFLLLNGDIIFDIDLKRFYEWHKNHNAEVTIFTHPNDHPQDSGIIETDAKGKVTAWFHKEYKPEFYKNRGNAGLHLCSIQFLNRFLKRERKDLDRDILPDLIQEETLYAYDSPEYVKDMGTPKRLLEVEADLSSQLIQKRNLQYKQRAIFLDRDGTLNQLADFITHPDQLCLIPNAAKAVALINQIGFLAIVITNQPVIARGEVTVEGLQQIHNKLETLLGNEGAYLDAIFYCPHHPERGFPGERPEYKIKCNCRKPEIGLFLKAAETYHIDLAGSYFIGDSKSDMEAGKKAGIRTCYLGSRKTCAAELYACDLFEAVKQIQNEMNRDYGL